MGRSTPPSMAVLKTVLLSTLLRRRGKLQRRLFSECRVSVSLRQRVERARHSSRTSCSKRVECLVGRHPLLGSDYRRKNSTWQGLRISFKEQLGRRLLLFRLFHSSNRLMSKRNSESNNDFRTSKMFLLSLGRR